MLYFGGHIRSRLRTRADQAPDQVPYNDDSEPESEYALDEVSSDVEMNPEDLVNILSDEEGEGSVLDDPSCTHECVSDPTTMQAL